MKFILKINGSESPKAAYVGWTPVVCTLTIDGYSGQSPMPVSITTGHDGLEGKLSLYENNATSSTPIDTLEHDFQKKNEITFYVAGKYPHASVAKKDTFLKVESKTNEVPHLTTKVMVRVRKNANKLSPIEIEDFLKSFANLNNLPPKETYSEDPFVVKPSKLLHEIVLMHTYDAMFEIHRRTSFHPWHRAFLLHLERELQKEFPHVTVPYWKFDVGAENVFTTRFIGDTPKNDGLAFRPTFDQLNPLYTYSDHTAWGPLQRAYAESDPAKGSPSLAILTESQIIEEVGSPKEFFGWSTYEEQNSHNQAHNAFDGHVADPGRDPVDPLFFMMHSNVDRLWASWQQKHIKFDGNDVEAYPFQEKYKGKRGQEWAKDNTDKWIENNGFYRVDNSDIGNQAEDTLWPWNLDHQLSRPMRTWIDEEKRLVPQINIKFPDSISSNYPKGPLTVKSTIDYQARINNQTHLGFDYDTIPYFDHDRKTSNEILMANVESHTKVFLNSSLSAAERLKAAEQVRLHSEDELTGILNILSNKEEEQAIRLKSITLSDETTAAFLDTALTIISDPTESTNLRSKLIHKVFTTKRSNLYFPSRKPRFFDILRGFIRNSNQKLRFQSISILAAQEDAVVQQFLIEEIEKDQSELISKPDAIFFLRQNTKPQYTKLFRDLFEQSEDTTVRKAAIEGLDNDPSSVGLLQKVVLDEKENFKVREAGALSLHHIDPEMMNDLAARIIAAPANNKHKMFFTSAAPDPDEVDFKAGLLNMLSFTGDINRLKHYEGLKTSLEQIIEPNANKSNFRGSFEKRAEVNMAGPTVIEQMATKLLDKFEASDGKDQD